MSVTVLAKKKPASCSSLTSEARLQSVFGLHILWIAETWIIFGFIYIKTTVFKADDIYLRELYSGDEQLVWSEFDFQAKRISADIAWKENNKMQQGCFAKIRLVVLFIYVNILFVTSSVPINITYVNDNHVCPASRARWQDYTVYLETKPRLCMM